jgi:LPS-assembly lipoprotein
MRWLKYSLLFCMAWAGLAMGGCSYHPLYAKSGDGADVGSALATVGVAPQSTRAGQLVRNSFLSGLGGGGSRYVLKMVVTEKSSLVSSVAKTVVDRHRYRLSVEYKLLDAESGKELNSGKTFSVTSFDTVREPVADLQAEDNARARAADEVAQDLRTRVSAVFATQSG